MGTLAFDLNDSGLVVADGDAVLAVEPGYALVEGRNIETGPPAYAQARLKPRHVSNRYWAQLSVEPGSAGLGDGRSAAELAYAQLDRLWKQFGGEDRDAVFIVPGHYTREQLGLLLGLAEECRMPVRALVDAAVAASARPYPSRQLVYVDASLHRASVTPLEQGEEAVAQPEQGLPSVGLADLFDALARWFAERFVLATRFDPFHHAETEQSLYDRLPEWLEALQRTERAEFALTEGDHEFRIEVAREPLEAVFAGFNRAIVQLIAQSRSAEGGLVVQLSERLTGLPGLAAHLARLDDAYVVSLPAGHTARAGLAGLDRLESDGTAVRLLKHLPWRERVSGEPVPVVAPRAERPLERDVPTHIVYRGVAYPVGADGLLIGRAEQAGRRAIVLDPEQGAISRTHCEIVLRDGEVKLRDLSRYGTFVNERRVEECVLNVADRIRIGSPGEELGAIRVQAGAEDVHGA